MKLTKYVLLQIVLLPIYVLTLLSVALNGQDPTSILVGSITICGALSALSFTANSNLKEYSHFKDELTSISIAGVQFLRATIYSLIALICYFFITSISGQLNTVFPQVLNIGSMLIITLCYGVGMASFHNGLLTLLKAIERPL